MSDMLIANLVNAMHVETNRVTDDLMQLKERSGFLAGFKYGLEEGRRQAQQEIRASLGIREAIIWRENADEAFTAWKETKEPA